MEKQDLEKIIKQNIAVRNEIISTIRELDNSVIYKKFKDKFLVLMSNQILMDMKKAKDLGDFREKQGAINTLDKIMNLAILIEELEMFNKMDLEKLQEKGEEELEEENVKKYFTGA